MVAVDPECQSRGIGLTLVSLAVEEISKLGIPLAEIGTGGDPGHAAARRVYEKAGFTALPRWVQASGSSTTKPTIFQFDL
jgi:GNAT superfamily N-acetyltransferase